MHGALQRHQRVPRTETIMLALYSADGVNPEEGVREIEGRKGEKGTPGREERGEGKGRETREKCCG